MRRILEGILHDSYDHGVCIDDPEATGGQTAVGGLFGYDPHGEAIGKRARIIIETGDDIGTGEDQDLYHKLFPAGFLSPILTIDALRTFEDKHLEDGMFAGIRSTERVFELDRQCTDADNSITCIMTHSGVGRWFVRLRESRRR